MHRLKTFLGSFEANFRHVLTKFNMHRIKACLGRFKATFKHELTKLECII